MAAYVGARLTKKPRVPYSNNGEKGEAEREMGDSQHSNREAKYRNLFWQNRLNWFQWLEYSVWGFFFSLSTSFVIKCMNALTRIHTNTRAHAQTHTRGIPTFSVLRFYIFFNSDHEMSQVKLYMIGFTHISILQKQEVIFGSNKIKSTFQTNNFQSVVSGWFSLVTFI